ncbi:MAG: DUF1549 domain-containing protein [Planctomycetota bacterium]|nr:DUF1549 domain-containing protein [Planctomycetota bacterium]
MSSKFIRRERWAPLVMVGVHASLVSFGLAADDGGAFFEKRIRPLLIEHCVECHGSDRAALRGGLRLDTPGGLLAGGDGGPVIVPGDPEASLLWVAISYQDPEFQMPPRGMLGAREREDVRRWIASGAVLPPGGPAVSEPTREDGEPFDWNRERAFWSYQPISDPDPPQVSDPDWCRNDIDRFILARLDEAGLAPAPEADRRTLIRRAHFDLIGLPPTPAEVDRFLEDDAPDAYSRMIERLLASPHYGERWGRHWLDVARYADSNGLDENTAFGNAWRYRDWVIEAINDDKPYDDFVVEQIAGDLLPDVDSGPERADRLRATGFLSLGPKVLAEPDKEKMQIDIVDEQLDVLGQAFLGQTIGCARCHDHKFDPITARDYHAMAGILYSTRTMESLNTVARVHERELASHEELEQARLHAESMRENQAALDEAMAAGSRELRDRWSSRTARAMVATRSLDSTPRVRQAESFDRSNLNIDFDRWGSGVGVIHTTRPDEIQFAEYRFEVPVAGRYELRVRYASDEERPLRVLVDGAMIDEDFCDEATGSFTPETARWDMIDFPLEPGAHVIRLERPVAYPHLDRLFLIGPEEWARFDRELERVAERHQLDPILLERWAFALEAEPIFEPWRAVAALDSVAFDADCRIIFEGLAEEYAEPSIAADGVEDRSGVAPEDRLFLRSIVGGEPPLDLHDLALRWATATRLVLDSWDRHRMDSEDPAGRLPDPGQDAMRRVLVGDSGIFSVDQDTEEVLATGPGAQIADLRRIREQLEESEPEPFEVGIAVEDDEVVDLPIFIRGEHTNPGDQPVPRGVLTVLEHVVEPPNFPEESSGRLELARWIVDPDNPLTPRVAVNRIWKGHFGRGIARNPSNFGTRGGLPSHPALLDWLSRRFMEDGWSIKQMHRRILHSATWRMGHEEDPAVRAQDPDNALYGRWDPVRLEAEPVRDALLSVGGELDLDVGGSLLASGNFAYVTNDQSTSNERYDSTRRAIYLPVIRNDMYPFFSIFDYPDSSVPVDARPRTVVAQQALFMMNSPLVLAQSERLARRLIEDGDLSDDEQRVRAAYLACFAREPDASELGHALDHLASIRTSRAEGPAASWPDEDPPAESIDSELLALRSLCQVLFSSNEFIYVR